MKGFNTTEVCTVHMYMYMYMYSALLVYCIHRHALDCVQVAKLKSEIMNV